jgi:nucleotide-binding universal stress UspA family protein
MIKRILVPLDGSVFAESALSAALDLAKRAAARLHLVSAQEEMPAWVYPGIPAAMTEWRVEYFDRLLAKLREETEVEITTAMPDGHVAEELEDEAVRSDADLVVMATHGRGPLTRAWLGSVADAFVRRTRRPVLMVRPPEKEAAQYDWQGARRILVPLDGSGLAEAALVCALQLGGLYQASYHLVRVVHFPVGPTSSYIPDAAEINEEVVRAAQTDAESYLAAAAERLLGSGLSVDHSVVIAPQVVRGILAAATSERCDVIAMATHGSRLRRLALGSVTDKVLRASELPVLLVRPGGEEADEAQP